MPGPIRRPARAARRGEAVSEFLLAQPSRLLAVATGLGDQPHVYESTIRGPSMRPAIPAGSRLRVRLHTGRNCKSGDIVFFLTPHGYMVHRVVFCGGKHFANGYLLTCGDNHIAPDPPVPHDHVLGIVFSRATAAGWQDTPAQYQGPYHRRAARFVARTVALVALAVGVRSANHVAKSQMVCEQLCRNALSLFRQIASSRMRKR